MANVATFTNYCVHVLSMTNGLQVFVIKSAITVYMYVYVLRHVPVLEALEHVGVVGGVQTAVVGDGERGDIHEPARGAEALLQPHVAGAVLVACISNRVLSVYVSDD